MYINILFNM